MSGLHDFSDDRYWRSRTPREVVEIVNQQLDEAYADYPDDRPDALDVIKDALYVVGVDTADRAADQSNCSKVDPCHAKAAFLAWLSWDLDADYLNRFTAEVTR